MKKALIFLLMLTFVSVCTTACTGNKQKTNLIQSKRRFAEYVEPQAQKDPNTIDLSDGPKLKYDAKLGPKNLDFDIKIIDPY